MIIMNSICPNQWGGGGQGQEVNGRREKRVWEAGLSRWRELEEIGKNVATLRNILQ